MLQRYNDKNTQQKRAQTTNRLTCTNDPLLTCTDEPRTLLTPYRHIATLVAPVQRRHVPAHGPGGSRGSKAGDPPDTTNEMGI